MALVAAKLFHSCAPKVVAALPSAAGAEAEAEAEEPLLLSLMICTWAGEEGECRRIGKRDGELGERRREISGSG